MQRKQLKLQRSNDRNINHQLAQYIRQMCTICMQTGSIRKYAMNLGYRSVSQMPFRLGAPAP